MSPATAEPIEMPFGKLTRVGSINRALDGGSYHKKGNILGLSGPLKSIGMLL